MSKKKFDFFKVLFKKKEKNSLVSSRQGDMKKVPAPAPPKLLQIRVSLNSFTEGISKRLYDRVNVKKSNFKK